jgi:hypothetical protein
MVQSEAMAGGRLIRVSKFRGDRNAVSYLVAVEDKAMALELIARQAASPNDEVQDLGPVSEALITTISLPEGQFMPISGVQSVAQQQQQIQPEKE